MLGPALTLLTATLNLAAPSSSTSSTDVRSVDEVIDEGRRSAKPVLLVFGAAWCAPCRVLEAQMDAPNARKALDRFVVQHYNVDAAYDGSVAERFGVQVLPTLIVLAVEGGEAMRAVGLPGRGLETWLTSAAELGTTTESALRSRIQKNPDDVEALADLYKRKRDQDPQEAAALLERLEATDRSPSRVRAARTAWLLATDKLRRRVDRDVVEEMLRFIDAYPAYGLRAATLIAAAGADESTRERAFGKVIDASPVFSRDLEPPLHDVRDVVDVAIVCRAPDAARRGAEKIAAMDPFSPWAREALARTYYTLGFTKDALAAAREALQLAGASAMARDIRADIERFQAGKPVPQPPLPTLAALFPARRPSLPPSAERAYLARMYATVAVHKAAPSAFQPCVTPEGMRDVYVRVQFDPSGEAKKAEVLEPGAPIDFRRCVETRLVTAKAPPASEPVSVVVELHPLPDVGKAPTDDEIERSHLEHLLHEPVEVDLVTSGSTDAAIGPLVGRPLEPIAISSRCPDPLPSMFDAPSLCHGRAGFALGMGFPYAGGTLAFGVTDRFTLRLGLSLYPYGTFRRAAARRRVPARRRCGHPAHGPRETNHAGRASTRNLLRPSRRPGRFPYPRRAVAHWRSRAGAGHLACGFHQASSPSFGRAGLRGSGRGPQCSARRHGLRDDLRGQRVCPRRNREAAVVEREDA